jgi:hypothetical protein
MTKQKKVSYTRLQVMTLLYAERQKFPSMRAMAKAWDVSHETIAHAFRTGKLGVGSLVLERLGLQIDGDWVGKFTRYVPQQTEAPRGE